MQRASSQYSSWELWLVPFLQKPTQESKVIPAWMGTFQSDRGMLLGLGGGTPPSSGMTNEYCWWWWRGVHLVWLLRVPGGASALQAGHILESHLRCLLGWVQDFPSEARWKRREKGSKNRGQLCSAVRNQGRTHRGRESLLMGDFFTLMTWGWRYPRLNQSEFRVMLYLTLGHEGGEMEDGKVGTWRFFQYSGSSNIALEEAFSLLLT